MSRSALDAIHARRTIRSFKPDAVPAELLQQLLEAACSAPTSGNLQPWEFIRVVTPVVKQQLVASTYGGFSQTAPSQAWLLTAPELIAVASNTVRTTARYGPEGPRYARLDVAAAIQNLLIAATALGLGSAWVGGFRAPEARQALRLDAELELIGLVAIGYPAESPVPPYRMPIADVLTEI